MHRVRECLLLSRKCYYILSGKLNGIVCTDDLRDDINTTAVTNAQVYGNARNLVPGEEITNNAAEEMIGDKLERARAEPTTGVEKDDTRLSVKVLVMQPILRFLQLLCENHNHNLQVIRYT